MSSLPGNRRVVVIDPGYDSYATEQGVLAPFGAEVAVVPCVGDIDRVVETVRDVDAVLVRESPVTKAAIDGMTRCRAIVRYGVGVDNIDLDAAAARGIYVANVPDYGVEEVSDHALALLLAVARRLVSRSAEVRAGAWTTSRDQPMYRLAGGTLGLIGYGRIGRAFHRKAAALGYQRVLVYDPMVSTPPQGAELATVEAVCRQADAISLHVPLMPETRHLIDAAMIAAMKPTAILVNTARGGLIDEDALAEAMAGGHLLGAGLDVFEQEPVDPAHPLLALPNVVATDHTAWYSEQAVADLQRKAAEEIARVFSGEPPVNWVNRWSEAKPTGETAP